MNSPEEYITWFLLSRQGKFVRGHDFIAMDTFKMCKPSYESVSFLPRRLGNAVADVERLDHCQEAEANEHAQGDGRGDDVQGHDRLNMGVAMLAASLNLVI